MNKEVLWLKWRLRAFKYVGGLLIYRGLFDILVAPLRLKLWVFEDRGDFFKIRYFDHRGLLFNFKIRPLLISSPLFDLGEALFLWCSL